MKKVLFLSSLGGILEFYDFIIFVFFASVIAKVFYPSDMNDSFWGIISVYVTFAVGYFVRPLGGIIMAHFGDKKGRKNVFLLSVLLMVVPTLILGILPSFDQIGYLAPFMLIVIRILQGISVGGELPGAWVYVSEHVEKSKIGFAIGVLTASVVGGIFFGGLVTLLLYMLFNEQQIDSWAFRLPFLLGGIFGIVSIYLRKMLEESPEFLKIKESNGAILPFAEMFKFSKIDIVIGMMLTWILTGCIVIIVLLMPNFMERVLGLSHFERLESQLIVVLLTSAACVVAGILADRFGLLKSMILFSILVIVCNGIFFYNLSLEMPNTHLVMILYFLSGFANGLMVFCPLVMIMLYPVYYRFSALGFSYNIAYAIFGGLSPIIVAFLMQKYMMGVGYYMMFLGGLGFCLALFIKNRLKGEK